MQPRNAQHGVNLATILDLVKGEALKKANEKGGKPVDHETALRRQTMQALRGRVSMLIFIFVSTKILIFQPRNAQNMLLL